MKQCIICQAYPGHRGTHYMAQEVVRLMSSLRGHGLGSLQWTLLPGARSAAGNRILASSRMPAEGDAHPVEGIWLLEQKEDLTGELTHTAPEASPRAAPPPVAREALESEGGTSLCLTWAQDGLRVEVEAVLGPRAEREAGRVYTDLEHFRTDIGVRATVLGAPAENPVRVALTAARGREVKLHAALGPLLEVLTQHHDPERVEVKQAA